MTSIIRYVGAGVVLVAVGCSGVPTVTRTGQVRDVLIREKLLPADISVNPGDEIRWINQRTEPARIIFLDPISGKVSCQTKFGGVMGVNNETTLSPDETASLCFTEPGSIRYAVRMPSAQPGGEINAPGSIRVQAGSASSHASSKEAP